MLIDSVIISLTRNGVGVKPSYSLTIYGYGTLNYYGVENVKVKGKVEEKIERDKIILLLSEFKNSGFFSIPDVYFVDKDAFRSFTTLSISLPISENEMKTKSLTYYDDENVPYELRKIEMKIDELADSDKWVKILSNVEPELEEKKEVTSFKKEEKKKTSSSKIDEAKKLMDRMER
jgi:hypothetical protein